MMDRRTFLAGTGTVLLAASLAAEAQPVPRVGIVTTTPAFRDAFIDALRRLGYQHGQNIIIDWRANPGLSPATSRTSST